ncbi:MAG: hypothetical protein ACKO96_31760, partial [Flammeovirgaceae bacterium]
MKKILTVILMASAPLFAQVKIEIRPTTQEVRVDDILKIGDVKIDVPAGVLVGIEIIGAQVGSSLTLKKGATTKTFPYEKFNAQELKSDSKLDFRGLSLEGSFTIILKKDGKELFSRKFKCFKVTEPEIE